ncbi:MAG: hypothetical protein HUJ73_05740, partial [Eubacterium sp.]|nr:hypothetical protein [Eubacterium sp.]
MTKKSNYTRPYCIFWAIYWTALLVFTLCFTGLLLGKADEGRGLRADGFVLLLFLIGGSILFCTFFLRPRKQYDENGKQKLFPMRPWHLFLFLGNSLYCFWIIEYANNPDMTKIKPFYVLINVGIIFVFHLLLLGILNSVGRAMIVGLFSWSAFAFIFWIVYQFRGEPFQLIDISNVATALTVTGNYQFNIPRVLVVDIIIFACLFGIYLHFPRWVLVRKSIVRKIFLRVAVVAVVIGGYFFFFGVRWNSWIGVMTDLFAPIKTYKEYGTTLGFFCVGRYMHLEPPEEYSVEKTEEIAERSAAETADEIFNVSDVKPTNIIAIMNESWTDYSYTGDLQTDVDPMPYYHSMKEDTIKGYSLVEITG